MGSEWNSMVRAIAAGESHRVRGWECRGVCRGECRRAGRGRQAPSGLGGQVEVGGLGVGSGWARSEARRSPRQQSCFGSGASRGQPVSGQGGGVSVEGELLGGGLSITVRRATRGQGEPAGGGSRESPHDPQLARQSTGQRRRRRRRGRQARDNGVGSAGRRAGVGRPALEPGGGGVGSR